MREEREKTRKRWSAALEWSVLLLVTAGSYLWGRRTGIAVRGSEQYGGECLFLLLPAVYCVWKRIAADMLQDFWNLRQGHISTWRSL